MRQSIVIAFLVSFSFVLGYGRDLLVAWQYGVGGLADSLFVALMLPVFFENIFGVALRDTLIPYLQELRSKAAEAMVLSMRRLQAATWLIGVAASILVGFGAQAWLDALVPGWGLEKVEDSLWPFRLGALLIAVQTVLYFQTAVLNVEGRFILPMWRTVLLNVGAILAVLLSPQNVAWVVIGMVIGQFSLLVVQQIGLRFPQTKHGLENLGAVRRHSLLRLMMPLLIATAAQQACFIAERVFASFLDDGAIAQLTFAFRISTIPLTLFAFSALALFYPAFSEAWLKSDERSFSQMLQQAIGIAMVFLVPASVLMAAQPTSVISVLLERGVFGAAETTSIAPILAVYGLALPGMGFTLLSSRILLSQGRGQSLMVLSIVCASLVIVLDFMLYRTLGVLGLALAYGIGSWVQAVASFSLIARSRMNILCLSPFMRWAAAAMICFFSIRYMQAPQGVIELLAFCCVSLVAHLICVRLLGDDQIFSPEFWSIGNFKNAARESTK